MYREVGVETYKGYVRGIILSGADTIKRELIVELVRRREYGVSFGEKQKNVQLHI